MANGDGKLRLDHTNPSASSGCLRPRLLYLCTVLPLEPKDRFALEAAGGWLMLDNPAEALRELDLLSPIGREHPQALMTLWEIQAKQRHWESAIASADRLIARLPDEAEGYIKRAYALHELKRTQAAWDTLHPASERFTDNWLIPYNLACYAAQLGKPADAFDLFRRAMRLGDKRELRAMALNDPDLEPIRSSIEKLSLS